jgi:hypothetical protein
MAVLASLNNTFKQSSPGTKESQKNHKIESLDYSPVTIANNLDYFIFAKLGCSL